MTTSAEARPRILVVDDEQNDRQLLQVLLAAEGFVIVTAASGSEALALIAQAPPDLILLDVMMPGMDGYEVAEAIKSNGALVPIPIIMVTVLDDREAMMRALDAGAEDFLIKPVHRAELYMRVRNLLRLKAYGDHQGRHSQLLEVEVGSRKADLVESERLYRSTFDAAPVGIVHTNAAGRWLRVNQRLCDLLGYTRAELEDPAVQALVRQEEQASQAEALEQMAAGTLDRHVVEEQRLRRRDGSFVWVRVVVSVDRGAAGQAPEFIVVIEDVTANRQLEEQLRQSQKLEVVGQLAGGVAHDFNNILTAILGFSELLLMELGPDHVGRTDVFEIKTAGERAAGLTRQLLAFSRKQLLQASVLDINVVIKGMEPMLRRLIAAHIDLDLSLERDVGAIKIDPTQLEQLVINLLVNAADAMPKGGKLTIETSNVRLDEHYRGHHLPVAPGDFVLLAVSDTGVGMDEATSRRIFEPFFTTKELGKGTGLGLATVYGIVKQSGGDIWVYSEPGHGSAFKIYLPQVTARVSATAKRFLAPESARPGTETILLVEDDEAVRRLARLVLERAGYKIVEAENPKEAFRVATRHGGRIDLLLSDLIMPESDGEPLYDRLRRIHPDVRVLYISGYADEAVVRHGVIVDGTPFLQKPFTPLGLCGKVREVLDAPGATSKPPLASERSQETSMGTSK